MHAHACSLTKYMNPRPNSNKLFTQKKYEELYNTMNRPIIIGDQLRNADNIGSLIRLADNIGALSLWFLGEASSVNQSKIRRAAASSYKNIPWSFTNEAIIKNLTPENYMVVALETSTNARNIYNTDLPEACALVVGHEQYGISPEVLAQADLQVYVPVPGPTKSLNVSHAAAVFIFEWLRRQL
jgi:tRNA G18 (ribose-2'-O)-methylase SpoU